VWETVKSDWRTASVSEEVRAKLTLHPVTVTTEDAAAVRAAGVSEEALVDAIHVCALFSMIVRLADSLGWDMPTFEEFQGRADGMLASGYSLDD
jgi:hypothetical protein